MSIQQEVPFPETGALVTTACRGCVRFEEDTPHAVYHGQRIYFCLPICLQDFEQDPNNSCLKGHPLFSE
jgi:YHS domain-containing protein